MKLSEKIKTYRKTFGLSQEQLAEKLKNFKNELLEQQELETNSKENTNIKKLTKKRK